MPVAHGDQAKIMRINLKRRYPSDDARRRIYAHIIGQICDEYDLDATQARSYFENGEKHLSILINYLASVGYKVSMYRFDGVDNTILSWGLEFKDDCELTLALKLRYADPERDNK